MVSHEQEVGRALATHSRTLLAYVRRRVSSGADAEDVAQEAVMRVLARARETLILDPMSYVRRAARNILTDRARRDEGLGLDDVDEAELPVDSAATPFQALEMSERLESYRRALEEMSPLRREVFLRRRTDEQSYDSIARDLRISVAAVQKHYSRAARDLRKAAGGDQ